MRSSKYIQGLLESPSQEDQFSMTVSTQRPQPVDLGVPRSIQTPSGSNFAAAEFETFVRMFMQHARDEFGEDFNNLVIADPVFMIADFVALGMDTISHKIDRHISEMYVDLVREPKNMLRICRQLGYSMKQYSAATARFVASLPSEYPVDVLIPRGHSVSTTGLSGRKIRFELYPAGADGGPDFDSDIIIPAGSLTNADIIGIEGTLMSTEATSNGQKDQFFVISERNLVEDSVRLSVNGVEWRRTNAFTANYPEAAFRAVTETNGTVILLGDGKSGAIPSAGTLITITYRTSTGRDGNIAVGAAAKTTSVPVRGTGFVASVRIQNYTAGSGGRAPETVPEARQSLARHMASQDRCVTAEDYANVATNFSSPIYGRIARAVAAVRHAGCAANIIDLYVLALSDQSLVQVSDGLRAELAAHIDRKKMMNVYVCIKDGGVLLQDVDVQVVVDSTHRRNRASIEEDVRDRLRVFFDISRWNFGMQLMRSDMIRAINNVSGIVSVNASFGANNFDPDPDPNVISPSFDQIIRPRQISVSVDYL